MSRVIRVSDRTFRRIQHFAVPLEDTPDSVLEKILDQYELLHGGEFEHKPRHQTSNLPRDNGRSTNMSGLKSIEELLNTGLPTKIKPKELIMNGKSYSVSHWTDVCVKFVEWMIDNKYLTERSCPVPNSANQGKYFINLEPRHQIAEKDAVWKVVGRFYVDTKYWINAHIQNLAFALKYLNARDVNVQIRLSY